MDSFPAYMPDDNELMRSITHYVKASGLNRYFKPEKRIKPEELFDKYRQAFEIGKDDEMRIVNVTGLPDTVGYDYKHYYKN